ncbi:tRNA (adenosine(37)-N6)-dimethylallyltransferase MiaA [Aestuariivivens sediminicola]|uniref:tRNA (adenosine(37)-N6)-dimethylallyltransferase MiaA n=1 Tax=Aestuariivivens sediminicola TaxID=2913560 RepID=UPI001F57B870|nr:tRNA (adenosine(37)-N6)-dimethylallyltransferase MiaA [Aestuariivivens sediminicola]
MMQNIALNVVANYIMTKYLISVIGPTAIGKTALSIKLAQYYKTEIISADSRQFFKELSIGTAAPTAEDLKKVRHHFIHHKSIHDDYNVGSFEKEALQCLENLFKHRDVVVMVGGSGLYIDAVTKGLDYFPDIAPEVRDSLNYELETEGLEHLQNRLKALDPATYTSIALDNPHRVIRALEVCLGTGKPYSSFLNKAKDQRDFKTLTIGLQADRDTIYNRINRRVDMMVASGLLDEVRNLLPHQDLNALNTVGYKELFRYFNGEWSLDFAISEIKKNSRRYAKRQLTWFRKNPHIVWFNHSSDFDDIAAAVDGLINKTKN